eukprot:g51979.t1
MERPLRDGIRNTWPLQREDFLVPSDTPFTDSSLAIVQHFLAVGPCKVFGLMDLLVNKRCLISTRFHLGSMISVLFSSNVHFNGKPVNLFISSQKRRPCDGNVGWPVCNEEEDEDEDKEADEEVEEQDEEAAEDDEEDEEEVELEVEVVKNESEKDSESQASHPTPRKLNTSPIVPDPGIWNQRDRPRFPRVDQPRDGKTRLPLKWEILRMPPRSELALDVYQLGKGKTHWHDNTSLNFEASLRIRDAL